MFMQWQKTCYPLTQNIIVKDHHLDDYIDLPSKARQDKENDAIYLIKLSIYHYVVGWIWRPKELMRFNVD